MHSENSEGADWRTKPGKGYLLLMCGKFHPLKMKHQLEMEIRNYSTDYCSYNKPPSEGSTILRDENKRVKAKDEFR